MLGEMIDILITEIIQVCLCERLDYRLAWITINCVYFISPRFSKIPSSPLGCSRARGRIYVAPREMLISTITTLSDWFKTTRYNRTKDHINTRLRKTPWQNSTRDRATLWMTGTGPVPRLLRRSPSRKVDAHPGGEYYLRETIAGTG